MSTRGILNSLHCLSACSIPSITEDTAREALVLYTSSKCCYSSSPAKDGIITNMEAFNTYRVRERTLSLCYRGRSYRSSQDTHCDFISFITDTSFRFCRQCCKLNLEHYINGVIGWWCLSFLDQILTASSEFTHAIPKSFLKSKVITPPDQLFPNHNNPVGPKDVRGVWGPQRIWGKKIVFSKRRRSSKMSGLLKSSILSLSLLYHSTAWRRLQSWDLRSGVRSRTMVWLLTNGSLGLI